ncbi:glycosyl transferase, group 1 [gamma proteobacterium NOR5-3]|nr:glycosyl transferase, group 1 [gamma proteobacterium NOR5-3]
MRIGGTEQVIRNLVEATDDRQLVVSIFCIEEPLGPWGEELRKNGTEIHGRPRSPGVDFQLILALRRHVQAQNIDVVHCHQYTPWVYGALASAGLKSKVIFTEHGRFYPDASSPKRRYVNPVLARLTDHITAISAATKQALVDYEFLNASKIDVIYNGIKALQPEPAAAAQLREKLGIHSAAPIVGTIARLDPIKNHLMMLEAFRIVLNARPDARLLLVGDGEERARIEEKIKALELSDAVVMPGYLTDPTAWLELMNVYLLSSFSEGTSMTLLEAMSLGKPCVVTAVGGNPEIVKDQITGSVVESDNAPAFANAILTQLTATPDQAAKIKQRFNELFTQRAMAEHYAKLYSASETTATFTSESK